MTRYQFQQLSALVITTIAGTQLLATFAALFNVRVGLIIFIPVLLSLLGWACFEGAKFLKIQESGFNSEEPQNTNLPWAIGILLLVIMGGLMGVLWTD